MAQRLSRSAVAGAVADDRQGLASLTPLGPGQAGPWGPLDISATPNRLLQSRLQLQVSSSATPVSAYRYALEARSQGGPCWRLPDACNCVHLPRPGAVASRPHTHDARTSCSRHRTVHARTRAWHVALVTGPLAHSLPAAVSPVRL